MTEPAREYSPRQNEDVARAMGLDGTPAPAWVKSNIRYYQAWKRGMDQRGGPKAAPKSVAAEPVKRPRRQRAARRAGAAVQRSQAFSPSAAYQRSGAQAAAGRVSAAGDAGGLLLALVLYPVALATVRYGAAGPGAWFRAKWLNQPTSGTDHSTPAAPSSPQPAPSTSRTPAVPQ